MMSSSDPVRSPDEFINNTLHNYKPSVAKSAFESAVEPVLGIEQAANILIPPETEYERQHADHINNIVTSINTDLANPNIGTAQKGTNFISNIIGFGLIPGIGEAAGATAATADVASGLAGRALAKVAPNAANILQRQTLAEGLTSPGFSALSKYLPAKVSGEDFTAALLGKKAAQGFAVGAGIGVPQAIVDNYNADTNHINMWGVAKDMGNMGIFGLKVGSIPFAWGVLRGTVKAISGEARTPDMSQAGINQALSDGHINEEQHAWLTDVNAARNNKKIDPKVQQDLNERASKMLADMGHDVNSISHEVSVPFVSAQDVDNLKAAIADQHTSDTPEEKSLAMTDYIIHNSVDGVVGDKITIDGLRGHVDIMKEKLARKDEMISEANKILEDHLLKKVKDVMPFSQNKLFRMMKKFGFEESHIKHMPMTIPDEIQKHIDTFNKMDKIQKELIDNQKKFAVTKNSKYEKQVRRLQRRLNEQPAELPKILTPKEELIKLKNFFLGENGLPKNFRSTKEYHRLQDLGEVWENAKILLNRIDLDDQYNKQEAFVNLADGIIKIADSNSARLSKPENVIDYLKKKLQSKIPRYQSTEEITQAVDERNNVPADSNSILDEQEKINERLDKKAKEQREDYETASGRYREFEKSESVFSGLIDCVLGAMTNATAK